MQKKCSKKDTTTSTFSVAESKDLDSKFKTEFKEPTFPSSTKNRKQKCLRKKGLSEQNLSV